MLITLEFKVEFSRLKNWDHRNSILSNAPGIYIVIISDEHPIISSSNEIFLHRDVSYIGMTHRDEGLAKRVDEFDKTICGNCSKQSHGGADRLRFRHQHYPSLRGKLYIAVCEFQNYPKNSPERFEEDGRVRLTEYFLIAEHLRHNNKIPSFNEQSKKIAPKYSSHYDWKTGNKKPTK